jgi:hypothetical protein
MRRRLAEIVAEAVAALQPFGARAGRLIGTAEFIAFRNR